jgi:adenine-specific DNA methylase
MNLFDDNTFFQYQLPEPQYLGAKYTLLSWINQYIPSKVRTAIDAFSGTQSVSFLLKQLGKKVYSNDFMRFNHHIGLALIENKTTQLTPTDIAFLLQPSNDPHFQLIKKLYTNLFFEVQEATFLDSYRANVELLDNPYKKSLALAIMNRAMQRKITMGHFGHTQALVYAQNAERVKRNRNLARPIKDIFCELVPQYNQAVFDNGQENRSFCSNTLDILPNILEQDNIDFVYFDPPYCDSHADYQSFYHLTETYTEYWHEKSFVNSIKRYEPQRFSGFDKKRHIINSLHQLFGIAKTIPVWLISYNNRSYPSIAEFVTIIKQYKDVQIVTKTYQNGRGGKGSVAGSDEVLFVCNNKTIVSFNSHKSENVHF